MLTPISPTFPDLPHKREVEHALTQVETFPEAAEPLRDRVSRRHLHTFPCALRTDEVRVLAVAYQRRRPFYWEDRR